MVFFMSGSFKGLAIRIINVGRRGKRGIQTATLRTAPDGHQGHDIEAKSGIGSHVPEGN
jgi:hypothetical protein